MRQRASLDMIADDRAGLTPAPRDDNDADPMVQSQEDSRSTSSTSSPAPADNEESDFFLGANDSQSSLGVPNLQDIQVEDECLPPVNRLPNEILISVFAKLSSSSDILHVMLTCKRWARNAVDILWHRPACSTWDKHASICQTLGQESPYFAYREFIKRLNLASLADKVNDGSVMPLSVCTRVERLTLTGCKGLTDSGLIALVQNSTHLLALDISLDEQITEASIYAIAENCQRLQGLNISGCNKISNESMVKLAETCRYIKRLKLNDCNQLTDDGILAFAQHCPNILEIDLHQCRLVGNDPVTSLLAKGQALRELRLAHCELVDDSAFLSLPLGRSYEHLRILDLTSCVRLTDRAVEKIIDVAPRLRNLVLAKCRNITDAAVYAISRLGKNLHYVHLGHCGQITDDAVKRLVQCCNRIRYIDLGCCVHLTDDSVTRLAQLPKLKRIGLVKCANITDDSVYALARANTHRVRSRKDGTSGENTYYPSHSSLERVHLSYCTNLTLKSIMRLLNSCPRLTHLSLTGVQAFLREDLDQFCRDAPPEFTEHQRSVFCVFSGQGVVNLRKYLNYEPIFATLRDAHPTRPAQPPPHQPNPTHFDGGFDDADGDAVDDDDGLEDEMVVDPQHPPPPPPPPHAPVDPGLGSGPELAHSSPPADLLSTNPFAYVQGHPPYVPQHFGVATNAQTIPSHPHDDDFLVDDADAPSAPASTVTLVGSNHGGAASTASVPYQTLQPGAAGNPNGASASSANTADTSPTPDAGSRTPSPHPGGA